MITDSVIVVRLLLSFVSGLAIGLERSSKLQAAGLRTHTLICVGATGVMLLSLCVSEITGDHIGDPGRIAAQVVSGMGFLGGGAILKMGANVKGLTTATTIWVTAGIGLVIGAGLYSAGAMLVLLVLITLAGLDKIEKCVFPTRQNKRLEIQFSHHEPEVNEVM
ncbi:MgtC/SapB family protein, partial [Treponema pallidum]